MKKEIRITLDEVIRLIKNNVDINYDLSYEKHDVEDREYFIENVYYTYIREVNCKNELNLKYINCALMGNLASWYSSVLCVDKVAPSSYRNEVVAYIEKLFKDKYEVQS